MILPLTIIFLVFGVILGSFLNVVILRYNTNKSFGGRSACMSCQVKLKWYELVPVLSFLFLRGRCAHCGTKISSQYPVVESITGLVFAALFLKLQDVFFFNTVSFTVAYAYYTTMFALLLVVAVYDLKHKIIPDFMALVFGILAFLGLFLFKEGIFYPHLPGVLDLTSGLFLSLPFALTWLLSKGAWMGLGDAKLALGLGWLLGIHRILSGAVIAFWSGAIVGLFLIIFYKNYGAKSEIPFAPFLVLGTIIALLFDLHLFPFGV